jgi:hypothetical protein
LAISLTCAFLDQGTRPVDSRESIRLILSHQPRRKILMDYTVIFATRQHFGNEATPLPGDFVGNNNKYTFDCPGVLGREGSKPGVLMFQALEVHSENNVLQINGIDVFLPTTTTGVGEWSAQVQLVNAEALKPEDNELFIESRTLDGSQTGNIDDFVIDNMVIFYETT